LCAALAPAAAQELSPAQLNARAKAQNVPEIPFDSAPNFLELPPNLYLDEGTNMVIKFNPAGQVVMLLGRRPESVEGLHATPAANAPVPPAGPYLFNR